MRCWRIINTSGSNTFPVHEAPGYHCAFCRTPAENVFLCHHSNQKHWRQKTCHYLYSLCISINDADNNNNNNLNENWKRPPSLDCSGGIPRYCGCPTSPCRYGAVLSLHVPASLLLWLRLSGAWVLGSQGISRVIELREVTCRITHWFI
jgi:hypothetical protein